jgi:hypothetical protein
MKRQNSIAACIVIFLVGPAFAASSPQKKAAPKVAKSKVQSESHHFSDLRLKGQLKKPELSYIYKRKGLRVEKIVNIPEDFNDEIIQDSGKF